MNPNAVLRPFHLAFPVGDLDAAHRFYTSVLGCAPGRRAERWADFDFFGHQISAHLVDIAPEPAATNAVDRRLVPARHFGVILAWDDWQDLVARLGRAAVEWLIEPTIRFAGEVGEQATCFILDPSGNALEFKAFRDDDRIFAH